VLWGANDDFCWTVSVAKASTGTAANAADHGDDIRAKKAA